MNENDIIREWEHREKNKKASTEMWDSMASGFGDKIVSFEENPFLQLIIQNGMLSSNSRILDVGCGTGTYSFALAGKCREVVGIDLSPKMISLARERSLSEGTTNVSFHCEDWHDFDLKKTGYFKSFDLVFAHMTPAVQSAETFLKLEEASTAWCLMSKPIRRKDSVFETVKKAIGLDSLSSGADREILQGFNLLFLRGIEPQVSYWHRQWKMKKNREEAFGFYINRIKAHKKISAEEEAAAKACLKSMEIDGMISESVETTISTLFWHI